MERIDKRIVLGVLLIVILIALIVMPIPGCKREDLTPPPPAISKDQAIAILVSEIIEPAAEYRGSSAFMLSEPLQDGDVITSRSGETYPIDDSIWFVFIDDEPMAFFAHDCRYVFIDGGTGSYEVINESWPPEINNLSMWDTENLDRGHVIELYSVLDSAVPIVGSLSAGSPSQAPTGDYGDAPDGQDAYYGILGRYPTLFNTANSQLDRPGGHTLNTGEETLGVNVSTEVDANDPADPDGVPNLVDADSDERISVIVEGTQAKLAFTVNVAPNAPDVPRYANALIDFDQSGNWSAGTYGTEWVVVNLAVNVAPGSSETVITPWFSWGNKAVLPSPVWMRLLLAREEVDESLFANVGGWDGSGQFEYGEVEDYFVFLTDSPPLPQPPQPPQPPPPWPPVPGNPPRGDREPPPGGEAQTPGPTDGTCGYNVKYYAIIISGGDNCDDLAKGEPSIQESVDTMAKLAKEQGYNTSIPNLGPGNNSLGDIGQAFDKLKDAVKCGDHVLIYICGHGGDGSIDLNDASGDTKETLGTKDPPGTDDKKDNTLADFLKKIPPCPDEDCDTAGKCCNVTVIIESCYAGDFNVEGVTGQGRTVIGTSTNECSWGFYPGGGVYTQGFDEDSRNPASDTNIPKDGSVSPMEAHKTAVDAVNRFNREWKEYIKKDQVPWMNSTSEKCECKCACKPSIDAEKWVGDPKYTIMRWVDEIEAVEDEVVRFRLEIENDGKCRNITGLEIGDFLPDGLSYADEAILFRNGVEYGLRDPDEIIQTEGGLTTLYWNLDEIEALAPGETVAIEYDAIAEDPGSHINEFGADAHCAVDPSKVVSDDDTATVTVTAVPPVQNVLKVGGDATCDCYFTMSGLDYECGCSFSTYDFQYECGCIFPTVAPQYQCHDCIVSIHFWAYDSSGGSCPITSVSLELGEDVPGIGRAWVYGSGSISTVFFEHTYVTEGSWWCGETCEFLVRARNSCGTVVETIGYIACPPHAS
jgi:hypothetical protein